MGRSATFILRLSVMACACAMLMFCVRAAQAQTAAQNAGPTLPQPQSAYGYVAGQGPVSNTQPLATGQQAQAYGYVPLRNAIADQPATALQQPAPQAAPQQAAYGYGAGFGPVPTTPAQSYAAAVVQQPYGYKPMPTTVASGNPGYGNQAGPGAVTNDPAAYYQAPYQAAAYQGANSDYRLGPGDKVRVTVFGETDLSGEYQIDGSGLVRLPLIGTLRAAGLTAPALENSVAGAFAAGYLKSPRVNVEIITYRPFYVLGSVNRPGEYAYVDNMSALNAVALAGGFTDQAVEGTVYVRHEGSPNEVAMPADQLTMIRPGDVVRVKTSLFWDAMNVFSPLSGPVALGLAVVH